MEGTTGVPADILLYAIVAAGLVFWLKNILGTRHGDERQRPNPFSSAPEESADTNSSGFNLGEKNFDSFGESQTQETLPRNVSVDNDLAEQGLADISKADRGFDFVHFITGAQDAFILIVEAFAKGDRQTLQNLLSEEVYRAFASAIEERERQEETVSTEIHSIRKAEILDAKIHEKTAYITIRFTADETCVIRDHNGEILSGDPDRITEMKDIWVFGRAIKSRDPAWLVYETRDEEPEDHKTPVPETT